MVKVLNISNTKLKQIWCKGLDFMYLSLEMENGHVDFSITQICRFAAS